MGIMLSMALFEEAAAAYGKPSINPRRRARFERGRAAMRGSTMP